MYYTGVDPRTMEPVYVPKNPHEKALQRALIQYRDPKNRDMIEEALTLAGRRDLIGFDKKCLIRPKRGEGAAGGYVTSRKTTSNGRYSGEGKIARVGKGDSDKDGRGRQQSGKQRGQQSGKGQSAKRGTVSLADKPKKTIRNVHKKKTK